MKAITLAPSCLHAKFEVIWSDHHGVGGKKKINGSLYIAKLPFDLKMKVWRPFGEKPGGGEEGSSMFVSSS